MKKKKSNEPLKASILSHCIYTERRLRVLGELFHRHGLSLYDYLKQAKRKGII